MTNYYRILGVENFASKEAIKTAYRKLSKKFHPDVNEGDTFFTAKFKEIQEAYEHLADDARRKRHDEQLHHQSEKPSEPYKQKSNNQYSSSSNRAKATSIRQNVKRFLIFTIALVLVLFFLMRYASRTVKESSVVNDSAVKQSVEITSVTTANKDTNFMTTTDKIKNSDKNVNEISSKESEKNKSSAYFSIGSSKDDVLQVQGNPTRIMKAGSNEYWYFGSSSVDFENGSVSSFSNSDHALKVKLTLTENKSNSLTYFSIGSSKDDVLQVQGNPTRIMKAGSNEYWYFGSSSVDFENGRVSSFSNSDHALKVKLTITKNKSNSLTYFSIGSSKNDVLQVQGDPTRIMKAGSNEYWYFGSSSVDFENGRVSSFSNSDHALKVKLTLTENKSNSLKYFSIGSSKNDVLQVQGDPTRIMKAGSNEYWYFGSSSVDFENGSVSSFSNSDHTLKVKL